MGVEVVLYQDDLVGGGEVDVGEIGQRLGVVERGAPIGHLHVPPAVERGEHHEEIGRAVALVFMIDPRRLARLHRHWHTGLGNELL